MSFTTQQGGPIFLVIEFYKDGDPVTNLAELGDAAVEVRKIDESPMPGAVLLGPSDYVIQSLLPDLGQYVLRFDGNVDPDPGQWSVHVYDDGTPTKFDPFGGVITVVPVAPPTQEDEALWMLGRNTFGIATGFDATGQVTQMTIFGFDTADDARTYANAYDAASGVVDNVPAPVQALIKSVQIESYVYNPANQRFRRYLRTIEEV